MISRFEEKDRLYKTLHKIMQYMEALKPFFKDHCTSKFFRKLGLLIQNSSYNDIHRHKQEKYQESYQPWKSK